MTSFFFYQIQLTTHSFLIFNSFSTEKINRSPIIKGHLDEFKFRYINSKTLVLQFFSQQSHSIKKALFSSSLYLLLILYIYIYIYISALFIISLFPEFLFWYYFPSNTIVNTWILILLIVNRAIPSD